jgi:hypothetical protein
MTQKFLNISIFFSATLGSNFGTFQSTTSHLPHSLLIMSKDGFPIDAQGHVPLYFDYITWIAFAFFNLPLHSIVVAISCL